jgi:hypothetical protein
MSESNWDKSVYVGLMGSLGDLGIFVIDMRKNANNNEDALWISG